jgi:hypothetical protein
LIRFRNTGASVGHVDDDELTNKPNAGQYLCYVGNFDLEVEERADLEDVAAMGCRLTQGVGGRASSDEKREKRKGRDETHVDVSRRKGSSRTKV